MSIRGKILKQLEQNIHVNPRRKKGEDGIQAKIPEEVIKREQHKRVFKPLQVIPIEPPREIKIEPIIDIKPQEPLKIIQKIHPKRIIKEEPKNDIKEEIPKREQHKRIFKPLQVIPIAPKIEPVVEVKQEPKITPKIHPKRIIKEDPKPEIIEVPKREHHKRIYKPLQVIPVEPLKEIIIEPVIEVNPPEIEEPKRRVFKPVKEIKLEETKEIPKREQHKRVYKPLQVIPTEPIKEIKEPIIEAKPEPLKIIPKTHVRRIVKEQEIEEVPKREQHKRVYKPLQVIPAEPPKEIIIPIPIEESIKPEPLKIIPKVYPKRILKEPIIEPIKEEPKEEKIEPVKREVHKRVFKPLQVIPEAPIIEVIIPKEEPVPEQPKLFIEPVRPVRPLVRREIPKEQEPTKLEPPKIRRVIKPPKENEFRYRAVNDVANDMIIIEPKPERLPTAKEKLELKAKGILQQQISKISIFHDESNVIHGGDLTTELDVSLKYGHITYQSPGAQDDSFCSDIYISKGRYTISTLCNTTPDSGKIDWYLSNKHICTQDLYSAEKVTNLIKSSKIEVENNGSQVLQGIISEKNDSSLGFKAYIVKYWITKYK